MTPLQVDITKPVVCNDQAKEGDKVRNFQYRRKCECSIYFLTKLIVTNIITQNSTGSQSVMLGK